MSLQQSPEDLSVVGNLQVKKLVDDDLHPEIGGFPKEIIVERKPSG